MQPEHSGWPQLRAYAASHLSPHFADEVLQAARQSQSSNAATFFYHPFTIALSTLAVCLLLVVVVHAQAIHSANQRHLADWQALYLQNTRLAAIP
jgi:hypothetical protein